MPVNKTADNIAFKNINALSCHKNPTTNQPIVPIKLKYKSNICDTSAALKQTAIINIILAIHFIYQDKSPLGVIFLKTHVEFNSFILSSNFLYCSFTIEIHSPS